MPAAAVRARNGMQLRIGQQAQSFWPGVRNLAAGAIVSAMSERNPHAGEPFTDGDEVIAAALNDVSIPALLARSCT